MSGKKDMRRIDLVIPYVPPKADSSSDLGSTFGNSMPMAAMFTRNKAIGWFAMMASLLQWLGESSSAKSENSTPAYLGLGMSFMALVVVYMPLFLPPPVVTGTGTGAPAPVPA